MRLRGFFRLQCAGDCVKYDGRLGFGEMPGAGRSEADELPHVQVLGKRGWATEARPCLKERLAEDLPMRHWMIVLVSAVVPAVWWGECAFGMELTAGRQPIRRDAFNLRFDVSARGEGAAEVHFHTDSAGGACVVRFTANAVSVSRQGAGGAVLLKQAAVKVPESATLLIKRREDSVRVYVGERLVLEAAERSMHRGGYAWGASGGLELSNDAFQAVGDIYFADDFMRETPPLKVPLWPYSARARIPKTQELVSHGAWAPRAGQWTVLGPGSPETSAAIFQLCSRGNGRDRSSYGAGYWFWEDYIYAASLCMRGADDAAAMRFYERAEGEYFLLEWDGSIPAVQLVKVGEAGRSVVASEPIGFLTDQWYRIKVLVRDLSARVYIDDTLVLQAALPAAVCGGIGLEARSSETLFDDIQVMSLKLTAEEFADDASPALLRAVAAAENAEGVTAFFSSRPTMKDWATEEGAWQVVDGIEWNDHVYYSGTLSWQPSEAVERGTVALLLSPENGEIARGYRLVCSFDSAAGWRHMALFRDNVNLLARKENKQIERVAIEADGRVRITVGDEVLLDEALSAEYSGFSFGRVRMGDIGKAPVAVTSQMSDCRFARSPAGWVTRGTWEIRPRWTCDPRFSWFSGFSGDGIAQIWDKRRFTGDYTVEAYVACMLQKDFPHGYFPPINFRVTVGAEKMEPGSGYTGIYGYVDRPAQLLRNGVVVASEDREVDATLHQDEVSMRAEHVHRRWFHLKMQKKGSEVRFYVDRSLWFRYDDPEPLDGPYVCISTQNNGIMVSRVQITYEDEDGKRLVTR